MKAEGKAKIKIRLLFFGRLREQLQTAEEMLELEVETVADILAVLRARGGVWAAELDPQRALAIAVRQTFASADARVEDGDEVAIFPPVTGG